MKTADLISDLRVMFREAETYSQAGSESEALMVIGKMHGYIRIHVPTSTLEPTPAPGGPPPPEKQDEEPASDPG